MVNLNGSLTNRNCNPVYGSGPTPEVGVQREEKSTSASDIAMMASLVVQEPPSCGAAAQPWPKLVRSYPSTLVRCATVDMRASVTESRGGWSAA